MKPQKTTDPNQYVLQWEDTTRRERQNMIRAIDHQRTGLSRKLWANAVDVLCYFVWIEGEHGLIPKQETIGQKCRMHPRTVKRTIRDLVRLGILTSRRRGSTSNQYAIDFAALAIVGTDGGPKLAYQPGQFVPSPGPECPISGANLSHRHIKELTLIEQETNSSSTSAAAEEEVESFKRKVRKHLRAPVRLDEAVVAALSEGCTLDQLRERATWFQKNELKWKAEYRPGALYEGFKNARPGLAVDDGWPYKP